MGDLVHMFPRHRAHRADRFAHPAYRNAVPYPYGRPHVLVDGYRPKHRK